MTTTSTIDDMNKLTPVFSCIVMTCIAIPTMIFLEINAHAWKVKSAILQSSCLPKTMKGDFSRIILKMQ
jgi:hypothetical protein